jgi:hypothetical protein
MDPATMIGIIIIGIIVIGGAIVLVFIGLRDTSNRVDPLQERLAEFASRGETATLEEIELSEELQIDDISRDGMKLAYQKGSALEELKKGDTFAIRFYLNPAQLGLDIKTNDYIFTEVEVMHNRLRRAKIFLMGVRFTRRGAIKEEKLFFERLQTLTNDDIHKWVTALYARQLRREKGLERKRFEYLEPEEEPE